MPVNVVSKITKVSNYKLWSILGKYIDVALKNNDYSKVTTIGLDETSAKKGHSYISLFVDLNKRRTLFIAEGKDQSTVKAFKEDLISHNGTPDNIKDISCDMSRAFISGVSEHVPNAKITFDKFHIMKLINKDVDDVRREEHQGNPLFKNTRYLFLKNEKILLNTRKKN